MNAPQENRPISRRSVSNRVICGLALRAFRAAVAANAPASLINSPLRSMVNLADGFVSQEIGQVILLEKYQGVYFAIPKVANSSLKTIMANLLEVDAEAKKHGGKAYLFNHPDFSDDLYAAGMMISARKARQLANHWKFTFVRNPWGRLVSFYRSQLQSERVLYTLTKVFGKMFWPEMPFDSFVHSVVQIPDIVANRHFMSQYRFVASPKGQLYVDFVGRFENLQSDFERVAEKLSLPPVELKNVNPGGLERSYHDFYTAPLRELVFERYKTDIALFNYQFD